MGSVESSPSHSCEGEMPDVGRVHQDESFDSEGAEDLQHPCMLLRFPRTYQPNEIIGSEA